MGNRASRRTAAPGPGAESKSDTDADATLLALDELPVEILHLIAKFAEPLGLVMLQRTCRALHAALEDTSLWRRKFVQIVGTEPDDVQLASERYTLELQGRDRECVARVLLLKHVRLADPALVSRWFVFGRADRLAARLDADPTAGSADEKFGGLCTAGALFCEAASWRHAVAALERALAFGDAAARRPVDALAAHCALARALVEDGNDARAVVISTDAIELARTLERGADPAAWAQSAATMLEVRAGACERLGAARAAMDALAQASIWYRRVALDSAALRCTFVRARVAVGAGSFADGFDAFTTIAAEGAITNRFAYVAGKFWTLAGLCALAAEPLQQARVSLARLVAADEQLADFAAWSLVVDAVEAIEHGDRDELAALVRDASTREHNALFRLLFDAISVRYFGVATDSPFD